RIAFGIAVAGYVAIWMFAADRQGGGPAFRPERTGFRPHWPVLVFAAIGIGVEASLAGLGPTALVRAGHSEGAAARLLSAFFFAFLMSRIVLGVVAHRFGSFTIYAAAIVLAVGALLVAVSGATGAGFVTMGVSAGMFFPGTFVTASRKMGEDPR